MEHSELLTKLLYAIVNDPSAITYKDVANLNVTELAIYMQFTKEQKSDPESKFAKHVATKAPSIDPFKENFCGDTVILDFAIPLAFYMGFSKMFLCGVDTDYSKGHFTENYISAEISKNNNYKSMINDDYSIAVPGYHYTCNFLTSRGRKIYKLTKSKRLEFIESVSMDDIFKT